MNETVRRIKSEVSLVKICDSYGIGLTKQGDDYVCLCPFHRESKPSLRIYVKTNTFHCFGCKENGDVIKFVMLREELSFKEAVGKLAIGLGIIVNPSGKGHTQGSQQCSSNILELSVDFYSQALLQLLQKHHPILEGFFRKRGILAQSIDRFKIGFAGRDNRLAAYLLKTRHFDSDEVLKTGLIRPGSDGAFYPFFRDRIIFPFLRNGKAVYITGRSLGGGEPKYLNLPAGEHFRKTIYNSDAMISSAPDIYITEGVIDCILGEQNGLRTISLAGLSADDDLDELLNNKEIYIVFDSEESGAGQNGAERLASKLMLRGTQSRIVMLPRGQGTKKVDLADYLQMMGREGFMSLAKQAMTLIDMRIESAVLEEGANRIGFIRKKVLPLICQPRIGDMERANYLEEIKEKLRLKTDSFGALKKETTKMLKAQERLAPEVVSVAQTHQPTGQDKEEALRYLRNPNLIQNLIRDITLIGLVGEDKNALALYLFSLTRKGVKPISAVIFGDSSGGKSHLVTSICSLIPEEDKLVLSSASAKSFEHASEEQLKHKFIVLQEIEGMEEVEPTIRIMQSEGRLARFVATKNETTGQIESVHKDVECPASIITTTTRDHVHPENSTRIFELYVNQTPEQTAQILDLQRERVTLGWIEREKEQKKIKALHSNAQRLIKNLKVVIPFSKHIRFPEDTIRSRRDFERFLSLIQAVALFRQYQKEGKRMEGGEEYIEADLEDYRVAYALGEALFANTFSLISDRARNVLRVCLEIGQDAFSRADLRKKAKEVGIHISENNKMLAEQLRSLEEVDAIEPVEGGKGKAYVYRLKIRRVEELEQDQVKAIPTADQIESEMRAGEVARKVEGDLGRTAVD